MKLLIENINWKDKFDITTTGMSYYDQFLNNRDKEYLNKNKNLKGTIIEMTPQEYIDNCVEHYFKFINPSVTSASIRSQRLKNKENMDKVKGYEKFHLPVLNIANPGQEGLHRVLAAEELGYKKVPVLVVEHINKDKAFKEKQREKYYNKAEDLRKHLRYFEASNTWETIDDLINDLKEELDWAPVKYNIKGLSNKSINYSGWEDPKVITIEIEGITFELIVSTHENKFYVSDLSPIDFNYLKDLNEGKIKDIAIDIEHVGGEEAYKAKLIAEIEDLDSWIEFISMVNRGGPYDREEAEKEIIKHRKKQDILKAKLSLLNRKES